MSDLAQRFRCAARGCDGCRVCKPEPTPTPFSEAWEQSGIACGKIGGNREIAEHFWKAALDLAAKLCDGREQRAKDDGAGNERAEWMESFALGIETGARHCACEIREMREAS